MWFICDVYGPHERNADTSWYGQEPVSLPSAQFWGFSDVLSVLPQSVISFWSFCRPSGGGKYCLGERKRYRSCNTDVSFRLAGWGSSVRSSSELLFFYSSVVLKKQPSNILWTWSQCSNIRHIADMCRVILQLSLETVFILKEISSLVFKSQWEIELDELHDASLLPASSSVAKVCGCQTNVSTPLSGV